MQKLIQEVQANLRVFIDQDQDLLAIASCNESEAALLLQLLRDLEQASAGDLFLLFGDDFHDPVSFVGTMVERLEEERRLASEAAAKEDRPPLPELPSELLDPERPAIERLRDAMHFARSLLSGSGERVIWALCPQSIHDRLGYHRFIAALLPDRQRKTMLAGSRVIVRDEPDTLEVAPDLARARSTRLLEIDLGPKALADSLRAEVMDEALPREKRMQSLLGLAVLDYAFESYDGALAAYQHLLGYYQETGNLAMQGMVLSGMGDVYRRQGLLEEAQLWYECAVPPASKGGVPVILYTVVKNLGDVAFKREAYALAEEYYDGVEKLATHLLDAEGKARALELRGMSQERRCAYAEAVESWSCAAELCRSVAMHEILKDVLGHLERVYEEHGLSDRLAAVRAERRSLSAEQLS